jgi:hypothetical protein
LTRSSLTLIDITASHASFTDFFIASPAFISDGIVCKMAANARRSLAQSLLLASTTSQSSIAYKDTCMTMDHSW